MARPAETLQPRWRPAPLLPRERAQDFLMVFVGAVLSFFACLAVIAALGASRAASGWNAELKGEATVLVRPSGDESPDAAAERAASALGAVKGVAEARVLETSKAQALVAPWLGSGAQLADLPLPRLIEVDFNPKSQVQPSSADLAAALRVASVDGTVDDHSRWTGAIERAGDTARKAAAGAAALIALAAAAAIAFATHASLTARREVVDVLHLTGAEDQFIVGLFQNRLAELAAAAGAIGATGAALVAVVARLAGGGAGLTPVLPIAWTDLLAVLPCPLIAAAVAAVAARLTAMRLVERLP